MYDAGLSIGGVARIFGMSRQAMWKILQRRKCAFRPRERCGSANHFYRGGVRADDHSQNELESAIANGTIARQYRCELCGSAAVFADGRTAIQAHHVDYNRPLTVMWLCQKCHHEWHEGNLAIERIVAVEEMHDEAQT